MNPDHKSNGFDECRRRLLEAKSFDAFRAAATGLDDLAEDGDSHSLAFRATLHAVGAGRPRNWQAALEDLVHAAKAGSSEAQGQLAILSRDDGTSLDPDELRNRIDLTALFAKADYKQICDRPRMHSFDALATPAECQWIMERVAGSLARAMIWDNATGEGKVDPVRSNESVSLGIDQMDVVMAVVRARIARTLMMPEQVFEVPQIMRYQPGQQFEKHVDYLDPQEPELQADLAMRGQRIGTFLLYLNDDYEAGETHFPEVDVSFRGKTGDGLHFSNVTDDVRPDAKSAHIGTSPENGEKWIMSQWIRDRAPKTT